MAFLKRLFKAVGKFFKPKVSRPASRKKVQRRSVRSKKIPRQKSRIKARPVRKKPRALKKQPRRVAVKKPVRPAESSVKRPVAVPAAKPPKKAATKPALPKTVFVGDITHYFSKIMVCVLKISGSDIRVGDRIQIQGQGAASFEQKVTSMQIESLDVKIGKKGQLVGLKLNRIAKVGDKIYKII